jgi:surfactin family lipopeptide synthetase A
MSDTSKLGSEVSSENKRDLLERLLRERAEKKALPTSFAQQRLWFLHQLDPNNAVYNNTRALQLVGPLSIFALRQSVHEIVKRHEVLRTTFQEVDGRPFQVIGSNSQVGMPVTDLQDTPDEIDHCIIKEAETPFDLSSGPLLRASVLRVNEEKHILLVTIHHILTDGWSMSIFFRELSELYAAFLAGRSSPLPELPVQYADYAHWQREYLQGDVLDKQLGYWKKKLSDKLSVIELPTDYPRSPSHTFKSAAHTLVLPKDVSDDLKQLSKQENGTLFMTLLAAFKVLLQRYTGQMDIIVGSPVAGRNHAETENLMGFFVNTLVLRTNLCGNPTFRKLLAWVRETTLEAQDHQDLPFEKLIEELHPERNSSHSPLFRIMFAFQNTPVQALNLPNVESSPLRIIKKTTAFELVLNLREIDDGLAATFLYSTDLFDPDTIERMAGHYQCLLEGIVADPEQRLSELPLLTDAERQQLLVEWNDTETDYPRDTTIHQLFEEQADRTPDSTAVVFEDQHLTYQELNQKSNQLAHYLRKLGVGPETLVGICVERSLEMIVGLLGILKAGGAYVPLDPSYPRERLTFMLEDTQAPVLLTQQHLLAGPPDHTANTVCLDSDWEKVATYSEENAPHEAAPDNLAYVIYTSGSTGKPKGVAIEHRSLSNLVHSEMGIANLHSKSRLLQFASFGFDASVWEVFTSLLTGAMLYIPNKVALIPSQEFIELLNNQSISIALLPPSFLARLLQFSNKLSSLETLVVGGEQLTADVRQMLESGLQFVNAYGPTEFTVCATAARYSQHTTKSHIGRPIANTQVYILDQHLNPVPVGVPGELHIGGVQLARGYLNRPELTAEKFIPHPFSEEAGARLYKTGDLARYLPDGNIEFLGRLDHQVKIRGFRIELGEIEAVLVQHPSVKEAVVMAKEDTQNDQQLVAYIVPNKLEPTLSDIRGFLEDALPEYMIPSRFVFLSELPLTPNGKVDRGALRATDTSRPASDADYIAPSNKVEERLTGIWSEILGVSKIGLRDNFFELGGHSLKATQVISRIRDAFQVEVPPQAMFESPTVEHLAEIVIDAQTRGKKPVASQITAVDRSTYQYKSSEEQTSEIKSASELKD